MREIAFDTETTGLDFASGDRVIEVGCVELMNHVPTGRVFRRLINPQRPVSDTTIRITGITDAMLVNEPPFEVVAPALLEFIGDSVLVAHNAGFDRGFLNGELVRAGLAAIPEARWIDTVTIARAKYPGAGASLDALCRRFGIGLESRSFHGALLDAQLLSEVYLELLGGRARAFDFDGRAERGGAVTERAPARARPGPQPVLLTPEDLAEHAAYVAGLGGKDGPLWAKWRA
jgi:DNA polymerase-3 subunit epsilon